MNKGLSSTAMASLSLILLGGLIFWFLVPAEFNDIRDQSIGFPDSDLAAHRARPWILAILCTLPFLATVAYSFGDTLDRYITRQFLSIFAICLGALLAIWLLIDASDKISDFSGSANPWQTAATYYGSRFPAILLMLLPYSLLLSLLYAFGKLSGQREVIAIVQAGRSIVRMAAPMIVAGAFCTALGMGLNYHWAPVAEGMQSLSPKPDGSHPNEASRVLYRSRESNRLWFIGAFPADYQLGKPLQDVEITITNPDHSLRSRITARSASWKAGTHSWTFEDAIVGDYSGDAPPLFTRHESPLVVHDWAETPWQLIKPGLRAADLGIPGLNSWLQSYARHPGFADPSPYRTHWHYRWALPCACLITVLLAAPLSIHFSRRGPSGGVFLAVVLSALMLLASNIALALGESGLLSPALSAWLPNLIFGTIGFYLFQRRLSGRPIYRTLQRILIPHSE